MLASELYKIFVNLCFDLVGLILLFLNLIDAIREFSLDGVYFTELINVLIKNVEYLVYLILNLLDIRLGDF